MSAILKIARGTVTDATISQGAVLYASSMALGASPPTGVTVSNGNLIVPSGTNATVPLSITFPSSVTAGGTMLLLTKNNHSGNTAITSTTGWDRVASGTTIAGITQTISLPANAIASGVSITACVIPATAYTSGTTSNIF